MKKENPSKVVIIPRPPAAAESEESTSQEPIIQTQSAMPASMPPAPPAPAGEEAPKAVEAEPAKRRVCKSKLPKKPITQ